MLGIVFLFVMFYIKHFICDYVLQFHYMIEEKGTYGAAGGIHHSGIHAVGTFIVLILAFGLDPHNAFVAAKLALFDFLVHYHIDWAKMNLGQGLTPSDKKYWWYLGGDQMLHYVTYAFIIGLLIV